MFYCYDFGDKYSYWRMSGYHVDTCSLIFIKDTVLPMSRSHHHSAPNKVKAV